MLDGSVLAGALLIASTRIQGAPVSKHIKQLSVSLLTLIRAVVQKMKK